MPTRDPEFAEHLHDTPDDEDDAPPPRRTAAKGPILLALAGSVLGAAFAALSTSDFMQHLDRQVHSIHCSFIPGAAKEIAESGCRTAMMSPYSSFFRETLWGGVPVSLWALAVFAFLAYRSGFLAWRGGASSGETRVLLAATALPVAMSAIYGALSVYKLDALCKVCVGIYAASAIAFVGALLAHRAAAPGGEARFGTALAEGIGLVAVLTAAYVALAPATDPSASMVGCGSLVRAEDATVMIPLARNRGAAPSIELLDPLCPSCKAFDQRLAASALGERLDLQAVLFPLDSACNWMVTEAVHPGACAVSEAVLCAAGLGPEQKDAAAAGAVLRWAFARQADLRALAARDERALRADIEQQFPGVRGCLGGALVKSKLTKSLRWAVANGIPVLTPQLFVRGGRMCDEDTDLGLEYTLARMLSPEAERERARWLATHPAPRPAPSPGPSVALDGTPGAAPAGGAGRIDAAAPTGAPAPVAAPIEVPQAEPAAPAGGAPAPREPAAPAETGSPAEEGSR